MEPGDAVVGDVEPDGGVPGVVVVVPGEVTEPGGVVVPGAVVEPGEVVLGEVPLGEFPTGTQGVAVVLELADPGVVVLLEGVVELEGLVVLEGVVELVELPELLLGDVEAPVLLGVVPGGHGLMVTLIWPGDVVVFAPVCDGEVVDVPVWEGEVVDGVPV